MDEIEFQTSGSCTEGAYSCMSDSELICKLSVWCIYLSGSFHKKAVVKKIGIFAVIQNLGFYWYHLMYSSCANFTIKILGLSARCSCFVAGTPRLLRFEFLPQFLWPKISDPATHLCKLDKLEFGIVLQIRHRVVMTNNLSSEIVFQYHTSEEESESGESMFKDGMNFLFLKFYLSN